MNRRRWSVAVAAALVVAGVAGWQLTASWPSAAPLPVAMVATTVAPAPAGPTELPASTPGAANQAAPAGVSASTMEPATVLVPSAGIYTSWQREPVRDGQAVVPELTAGMWDQGAAPSDRVGTVLLWGHVEHAFAGLASAVPNGVVYIRDAAGILTTWQITRIYTEPRSWTHPDLYTATGPHQLALVTCGGPVSWGHYTRNVIVIAQEVRS